MNKVVATSTPKPRAHYRIIYNQPTNLKGVKLLKGSPRVNDLEAAINSITDNSGLEEDGIKDGNKSNLHVGASKADTFVFLPKFTQKKTTVARDSPKKIITTEGIAKIIPKPKTRIIQTIPKPLPGPATKKRKLGDMALEAWNPKKAAADVPATLTEETPPEQPEGPVKHCRICGAPIKENSSQLIDEAGALTQFGAKLKAITGSEINDSPMFPSTCCLTCKYKVQLCFSLLIELQSSDEVVRCTYADLQEGEEVNPGNHIYTCQDCGQEVIGMKNFIGHFEVHMQAKTIGTNEVAKDQSAAKQESDNSESLILDAQMLLEEEVDDGTVAYQNDLGEYVCEVCGRAFKYLFLLQIHRRAPKRAPAAEPETKVCFVCKEVKQSTVLSDDEDDDEPCDQCKEKEKDADYVQEEETEAAEEEEEDENDDDDEDYVAEEEEDVPRKKTKNLVCNHCHMGFNHKYTLKKHMLQHKMDHGVYSHTTCHVCFQELTDIKKLKDHLLSEHSIYWEPRYKVIACQICSKEFHDLFLLKNHLRLYHDIKLPVRTRSTIREFICHICHQSFRSENAARVHMRSVHNLSNNQMECLKQACEECGKSFSVKQNLINHINSAHLKVKPLICDVCGEYFGKHSSLIFHKLRHTGEKPFQCSICVKSYRQRNDVVRHLARHVRDKEVSYDEAYAINTSTSKLITKRQIYLKDSTMKGIMDLTVCTSTQRRGKRLSKKTMAVEDENTHDGFEEAYEEVILQEGDYQVVENEGEVGVQYVYASDDESAAEGKDYVIQDDETGGEFYVQSPEGTHYLLNDKTFLSDGSQYVIQEDDNGERSLVKIEQDCEIVNEVEAV